jgi:futalosine hydrolase
MTQTAYFLGRLLAQKSYGLAINAGIAGTFNTALTMGSVVNVVEDCIPELGAEDGNNFLSVFELGLTDPETHPYSGGKLVNLLDKYPLLGNNETIRKLPEVRGITSNSVHGNIESIARIKNISSADVESMEGAAFLFACLSEHVPCLQIRSVSNRVEERDKSRWSLELALKNLNTVLNEIMKSLPVEG